jgi:SAM-dependent methyltransferase
MAGPVDTSAVTAANRAAWDASAALHARGESWDRLTAGFAEPGFSTLDPTLSAALAKIGLRGKRVVQVGCNNGREILSCLSLGAAEGLGIDQSAEFLGQASDLAARSGLGCRFLCADIYSLPPDTPRGFDLALVTIGVLNWMPDLPGFFASVAGLLGHGGDLLIYETHPFLEVFDPLAPDPFTPASSYFRTEPFILDEAIVYDGQTAPAVPPSYWFVHTMGAILNAIMDAGLVLTRLDEFAHSNREVDYDKYENREAQLPMCYLLTARKP